MTACSAPKMQVTAVVVNYTPYRIGRVHVNGQRILGTFGTAEDGVPGGGGGGHGGLVFTPGPATVKWMIGGVVGEDSKAGEHRTAEGIIPEPPKEANEWKMMYLGVHIYPDTVKFSLANDIPYFIH